ncbi:uncharacterized protein LOC142103368 [Mixophyes fleayi]|uniref:uncharacterized protein LOC142103368 n=1 Tax=Mixophyes fleayi TaxID=3061075 RepID=UPI003F4E1FCA
MENAVQKILRYLLRLNSKACQKTQKILSLIISVKVETLKHSTDFLPCVISISVGGNAVKQYISEELQNGFLMALTSLPISVIPHREDYYCPHYLTEEFIFSFAFQVTDRRQELKKSYCKIQQLLHRISIVNPEIILHCCGKIDTFVSLKTFDTTEENFAQQHGISLLVGRENYSRSENNEASLDCLKLHPIFGPSCKLHVTANMKKMSFTGGMTLKLVAVLKPSINKLSYKPSTMSSVLISIVVFLVHAIVDIEDVVVLTKEYRVIRERPSCMGSSVDVGG